MRTRVASRPIATDRALGLAARVDCGDVKLPRCYGRIRDVITGKASTGFGQASSNSQLRRERLLELHWRYDGSGETADVPLDGPRRGWLNSAPSRRGSSQLLQPVNH